MERFSLGGMFGRKTPENTHKTLHEALDKRIEAAHETFDAVYAAYTDLPGPQNMENTRYVQTFHTLEQLFRQFARHLSREPDAYYEEKNREAQTLVKDIDAHRKDVSETSDKSEPFIVYDKALEDLQDALRAYSVSWYAQEPYKSDPQGR